MRTEINPTTKMDARTCKLDRLIEILEVTRNRVGGNADVILLNDRLEYMRLEDVVTATDEACIHFEVIPWEIVNEKELLRIQAGEQQ